MILPVLNPLPDAVLNAHTSMHAHAQLPFDAQDLPETKWGLLLPKTNRPWPKVSGEKIFFRC